ncbi:hypothetical protein BDZ89DRAFT_1070867 [Hymenopellis radicata]|nr:hypothetical protein BDZ89DRAFT_1070867 [Hymenopellis radicata]
MQAPQVSLRERIAALQQRDARSTSPNPPAASLSSHAGALRAKIAKFEMEGAVPAPRGSFGMGAPPLAENGQQKRRGELYGNRIPNQMRLASNPPPSSLGRSTSPLPTTRRNASMSGSDFDNSESSKEKLRSFSASPPPSIETDKPRRPSFATALDIARRADADTQSRDISPSPTPLVRRRFSSFTSDDAPPRVAAPDESTLVNSIAVHFTGDSILPQTTGDSFIQPKYLPSLLTEADEEDEDELYQELEIPANNSADPIAPTVDSTSPSDNPVICITEEAPAIHTPHLPAGEDEIGLTEDEATKAAPPNAISIVVEDADNTPTPTPEPAPTISAKDETLPSPSSRTVEEKTPTPSSQPQDSPALTSSPSTSEARPRLSGDTNPEANSRSARPISMSSIMSDTDSLFTMPTFLELKTTPRYQYKDMPDSPFIIAPATPFESTPVRERPPSMLDDSSGSSCSSDSRGATFTRQQDQSPIETEFGVVTVHTQSHSFKLGTPIQGYSEPVTPTEDRFLPGTKSFSAVVHGKIREVHTLHPKSNPTVPMTPQMKRIRKSVVEPPPSPGSGDLALLMQNAALLESRLENGEIPSEAAAPAIATVQEEAEEEKAEKEEAPVVTRHKRTFRIPQNLGKSKSVHGHSRESSASASPEEQVAPRTSTGSFRIRTKSGYGSARESLDDQYAILQPMPEGESPGASRYLGSFRRLGNRHSVSTSSEISSDDSIPVATPPDQSVEFGVRDGLSSPPPSGIAWPSVSPSPKKGGTVGRAASFANQLWSRGRAKSGASMVSVADDDADRATLSSFKGVKIRLHRKPSAPTVPKIPSEISGIIVPPVRSHSLHARSDSKLVIPSTDTLPRISPAHSQSQNVISSSSETIKQPHRPFRSRLYDAFPSPPRSHSERASIDSQSRASSTSPPPSFSMPPSYSSGASLSRTSTAETHKQHLSSMDLL